MLMTDWMEGITPKITLIWDLDASRGGTVHSHNTPTSSGFSLTRLCERVPQFACVCELKAPTSTVLHSFISAHTFQGRYQQTQTLAEIPGAHGQLFTWHAGVNMYMNTHILTWRLRISFTEGINQIKDCVCFSVGVLPFLSLESFPDDSGSRSSSSAVCWINKAEFSISVFSLKTHTHTHTVCHYIIFCNLYEDF